MSHNVIFFCKIVVPFPEEKKATHSSGGIHPTDHLITVWTWLDGTRGGVGALWVLRTAGRFSVAQMGSSLYTVVRGTIQTLACTKYLCGV